MQYFSHIAVRCILQPHYHVELEAGDEALLDHVVHLHALHAAAIILHRAPSLALGRREQSRALGARAEGLHTGGLGGGCRPLQQS
jgi:hypothetical protein